MVQSWSVAWLELIFTCYTMVILPTASCLCEDIQPSKMTDAAFHKALCLSVSLKSGQEIKGNWNLKQKQYTPLIRSGGIEFYNVPQKDVERIDAAWVI